MEHLKLIKDGINVTLNKYSSLTVHNTYSKQILDPLTTLIKICLLNFKETGTKLSINYNKISFHSPDLFQGPTRWRNGDNRLDLHNLCNPIERSVEWYDCKESYIEIIFTMAINGLKKLKNSYNGIENSNIVCDALSHYITILEDKLKQDKSQDDRLKEEKINFLTQNENNINKSLRNMWENDEISIISNLLLLAKSRRHCQDITYIINSIECLVNEKDNILHEIILKYTTSL